jgi:hypothetical protein
MVDSYLAKLFGIAKATKEDLLHEVNKLRQLDPGHRHFEWNRPRAATFTLAENGYRVLAAVRKQEDIESLLAEAGTRRVVRSVEAIILDVTDAGQIAVGSRNCQSQNRDRACLQVENCVCRIPLGHDGLLSRKEQSFPAFADLSTLCFAAISH